MKHIINQMRGYNPSGIKLTRCMTWFKAYSRTEFSNKEEKIQL